MRLTLAAGNTEILWNEGIPIAITGMVIVFAALYVENLISRWQSRTAHETVIGVNVGTKALR